jgi:hypothetical protein
VQVVVLRFKKSAMRKLKKWRNKGLNNNGY